MKLHQATALLSFIIGNLSLLYLPELITGSLLYWLMVLQLLLLLVTFAKKHILWINSCAALFGLLWASISASQLMAQAAYSDQQLWVEGYVESVNIDPVLLNQTLPKLSLGESLVQFKILKIAQQTLKKPIKIQLTWRHSYGITYAGQWWSLKLNIKAIHSRLNQGGFDLQRWAVSQHMILHGIVKDAKLIYDNRSLRQIIVSKTINKLSHYSESPIMIALLFGERGKLEKAQQQQLLYSGIGHLMAISGMHIMLIATISLSLSKLIQLLLPTHYISLSLPWFISFITALSYAWLSGMNAPALRAILIFGLCLIFRSKGYIIGRWQSWLYVVSLLVFLDPLITLSSSFWLSCFAVAALIFLYQWVPLSKIINQQKRWYLIRLCHLQFGLSILLLPIQIAIFNGFSLGGLVANLIAIPLISLIVLPFLFIGFILLLLKLELVGEQLWYLANKGIALLLSLNDYFTSYWVNSDQRFTYILFIGWIAILIWRLRIWHRYGVTCFLLILLMVCPFFSKKAYRWRVDMLDIGHGLAIIIQQDQKAIIYDTGQRYEISSAAEKQIIPFLRFHNLTPELMIISHEHNDHSGGIEIIKAQYPTIKLISSTKNWTNQGDCLQGNKWQWLGLNIEILWPLNLADYADNSHSCVVRISDGKFSMLLTGDLEKEQELQLIKNLPTSLHSTILQIPHHASNTSSSYAFLAKVKPQVAINSVARYNPWGLPSQKTLVRYQQLHIPLYSTHHLGQITIYFYDDYWQITGYRHQMKPRWYHDWFGSLPKQR
ncbi:MAG: DNA internalization-related competence protein ComEC/Rec2 [Candidatus Schmidhempelia sp.]|nr:DNA internalization-related competence protein ComEC/Rec2 [Candidatus Schmidhempelia sp.]